VRSGDGWFGIADRVGVGAAALLDANRAEADDLLVPGDRLCLPSGADLSGACDRSTAVRSGEGWFSIADRVGVAATELLSTNAADLGDVVHPGDALCLPAGARTGADAGGQPAPSSGGATYTVGSGDSWFGIAARVGVSGRELLDANGASASDLLVPGDVISLPAGARTPESRAPQRYWVDLDALPVQGPCWYGDTWRAARPGGRRHVGVDVFTKPRDYVYAVVDGRLTDRDWDIPGRSSGNAWTLTAADGTYFYYAHLFDFAPGLRVGSRVEAGQILGWVGDTGNATGPHLHFQVHPDGGDPVNPYPILRAAGGCNRGTPYRQPSGWVPELID
jgi:LysM repeat protein